MPTIALRTKPTFLVPEVVQTSQMDCGPAVLKCLIEGFGGRASYGRLREACQTDIDGTSIDTIEEVARSLGLDAVQIQEPLDHVLLSEAKNLPAILVVKKTTGFHFIVVWRRVGGFVQIMDPGVGRRWMTVDALLEETYEHPARIPASVWRAYAGSGAFQRCLARRLRDLGIDPRRPLAEANADESWLGLAALDASIRETAALVKAGARRGREAASLQRRIFAGARDRDNPEAEVLCPRVFWSISLDETIANEEPGEEEAEIEDHLIVRGAVLVRVSGAADDEEEDESDESESPPDGVDAAESAPPEDEVEEASALSPELEAAINEESPRPLRQALKEVLSRGMLSPAAVVVGLLVLSLGGFVQALLIRGMLDVGRRLNGPWQQFGGAGAVVMYLVLLASIEAPLVALSRQLGRRLETTLRMDLLRKIPRLADQYFRSRPRGDMASRGHAIHSVRTLPSLASTALRTILAFSVAALAVAWIDPPSLVRVLGMSVIILSIPLVGASLLSAREERVQTHGGALLSFYLDAMLGLLPLRSHGAETALLREFDTSLTAWREAVESRRRAAIALEGLQRFLAAMTAVWIVADHLRRVTDPRTLLLMLYWSLMLPALAAQLGDVIAQVPLARTALLRMLEPLGAPEEEVDAEPSPNEGSAAGVEIEFRDVTAKAGGNVVLSNLDLRIAPGEHVAIVGQSGAGKSTLLGLLLGWNRVSDGGIHVDGRPLDPASLNELRRNTAWLDPEVHLWNQSLLANLEYAAIHQGQSFNELLHDADLLGVVERLRDGMQTLLGEGGTLVSGGEGQRVRLARALRRRDARLVLIDEGFRGLDRKKRAVLLERAREVWRNATLLCVTHDIDLALQFSRVVVIENGQVVEDGDPTELALRRKSRLAAMIAAEREQQRGLRTDPRWRRVRVEQGRVVEDTGAARE